MGIFSGPVEVSGGIHPLPSPLMDQNLSKSAWNTKLREQLMDPMAICLWSPPPPPRRQRCGFVVAATDGFQKISISWICFEHPSLGRLPGWFARLIQPGNLIKLNELQLTTNGSSMSLVISKILWKNCADVQILIHDRILLSSKLQNKNFKNEK